MPANQELPKHRYVPQMISDKGRLYWTNPHTGLRWRPTLNDAVNAPGTWAEYHQKERLRLMMDAEPKIQISELDKAAGQYVHSIGSAGGVWWSC